MTRTFVSFLVLAVTFVVASIVSRWLNWAFGVGTFLALFGPFVLQGLRNIPNNPPQKGVLTIFGVRQPTVLNEGWVFLPFFPYVFGYVGVEVKRVSEEFTVKVTTPDLADSEVPIELTYRPINELPATSGHSRIVDGFIRFLNNGGKEGVNSQLGGKINERVREWAMADEEGPQTWEELKKSRLEAASVLTKTIGFNHVVEIPLYAQGVPTVIWMRYFTEPRPTKWTTLNEKDWIGNDGKWKKVEDVILAFSDDEREREAMKNLLDDAVNKRRKEVQDLRSGNGKIFLEDLGIQIERLNVGEIKVLGGVAEMAEKRAKEEQEMKGEELELESVRKRIHELMEPPFSYSKEQALEIVQTERNKVTKTINETKLNISPETREMLEKIIPGVTSTIVGALTKGGAV